MPSLPENQSIVKHKILYIDADQYASDQADIPADFTTIEAIVNRRTLIDPNSTPRCMWGYRQYVAWKDAGDKIPVNVRTLGNARTGWPKTWSTIHQAVKAYQANLWLSGIGFMLTERDPYTALDLDRCVIDGAINNFALSLMDEIGGFWEFSPSGLGLRGIVKCQRLPQNFKTPQLEIYSNRRWITLTGNVISDANPSEFDDLNFLSERYRPSVAKQNPQSFLPVNNPDHALADGDLWFAIFRKNPQIRKIYFGDLSNVRAKPLPKTKIKIEPDYSLAVIQLLNELALATGSNAERMARMIRMTHLDKTKFDRPCGAAGSWLAYQIVDAIEFVKGNK